jgi:hypothetical protein
MSSITLPARSDLSEALAASSRLLSLQVLNSVHVTAKNSDKREIARLKEVIRRQGAILAPYRANKRELKKLREIIRKQEIALNHYQAKERKPLREVDALQWWKARATGALAPTAPMIAIEHLTANVCEGRKVSEQPVIRA